MGQSPTLQLTPHPETLLQTTCTWASTLQMPQNAAEGLSRVDAAHCMDQHVPGAVNSKTPCECPGTCGTEGQRSYKQQHKPGLVPCSGISLGNS